MATHALPWKRQEGNGAALSAGDDEYPNSRLEDNNNQSFWWSPAGMATRYAIIALLFGTILLYLLYGYYDTTKRQRSGLPPRPGFRWMARRAQRNYGYSARRYQQRPYYAPQQQGGGYGGGYGWYAGGNQDPNSQGFGAEGHPMPPPPYEQRDGVPPPVYAPPEGGSKVVGDQNVHEVRREGEGSASGENGVGVGQPPPVARP